MTKLPAHWARFVRLAIKEMGFMCAYKFGNRKDCPAKKYMESVNYCQACQAYCLARAQEKKTRRTK